MSADKLPESVTKALTALWNAVFDYADANKPPLGMRDAAYAAYDSAEAAILAALRERERETIERCAVVCLSVGANEPDNRVAEVCADKIRALLPPEEKPS